VGLHLISQDLPLRLLLLAGRVLRRHDSAVFVHDLLGHDGEGVVRHLGRCRPICGCGDCLAQTQLVGDPFMDPHPMAWLAGVAFGPWLAARLARGVRLEVFVEHPADRIVLHAKLAHGVCLALPCFAASPAATWSNLLPLAWLLLLPRRHGENVTKD